MPEKSHVALEHQLCQVCGHKFETGNILMDKRLKATLDRDEVTGYGTCPECRAKFNDGFVALIEIDETKSKIDADKVKAEHAYRTGAVTWLKKHVFDQLFHDVPPLHAYHPMVMVPPEITAWLQKLKEKSDDLRAKSDGVDEEPAQEQGTDECGEVEGTNVNNDSDGDGLDTGA